LEKGKGKMESGLAGNFAFWSALFRPAIFFFGSMFSIGCGVSNNFVRLEISPRREICNRLPDENPSKAPFETQGKQGGSVCLERERRVRRYGIRYESRLARPSIFVAIRNGA
jgi:hypothetical protein